EQRRHHFGFQGEGVFDWSGHPLFGAMLSGGYWYSVLPPNLLKGDLRIGGSVGGFIAGVEGNTAAFQFMTEYGLVFRLAFVASIIYMVPAKIHFVTADGSMGVEDLGGFGGALRLAFNW